MPTRTLCKISHVRSPSDNPLLFSAYDLWLQSFHRCEIGQCSRFYPDHLYTSSRPRGLATTNGQQLVSAVTFSKPQMLTGKTGFNRLEDKVFRVFKDQNKKSWSIRIELVDNSPAAWRAFETAMDSEILRYKLIATPATIVPPPLAAPAKSLLKQIPCTPAKHTRPARLRRAAGRKSR